MIGRAETGELNRAAQRHLTPRKCLELHLVCGTQLEPPVYGPDKGRTYDRKRSDPRSNPILASRGPSTYVQRFRDNDMRKIKSLQHIA